MFGKFLQKLGIKPSLLSPIPNGKGEPLWYKAEQLKEKVFPSKQTAATPSPMASSVDNMERNAVSKIRPREQAVAAAVETPSPSPQAILRGRIVDTNKMNVIPNVDEAIKTASNRFGVPADLLYDIAFAESSLDPNTQPNEKGAAGLFQFTPDTWQDVLGYANDENSSIYGVLPNQDRMDPMTAALMAAYLIKFGQLGKWDASEWNWGGYHDLSDLENAGYYLQSKYHQKGVRPSVRLRKQNGE